MKSAILTASLLAASFVATGCMPPTPARMDALSVLELGAKNRSLKNLKLGVLYSENTRNAVKYVDGVRSKSGPFAGQISPDGAGLIREVKAPLDSMFGEVLSVSGVEDARAQGAHLVAIVDVFAVIKTVSFMLTSLSVSVDFRDLNKEPITIVRGYGSGRVPYPAYSPRWDASSRAALDGFAVALSTNAELAAFAAKAPPLPKSPAAAPAVAAVPAAPSYRSDVEAPGFRLPEDESKFAIVVGVESYQALPKADHAGRDARAVKAHLLGLGYPERNIVLLTDQQAGKSGLEKYLESWLQRNTTADSKVLFYFSGHGAPNPEDGQAYLMPWDGDPKFLEATGYPVKRLYAKLNALKAKQVLVAMDACFSGVGGRSVVAKGTRPLVGKVDLGAGVAGRVAGLTASASDEVTGTDEASGHGLFTYQLLKSLNARSGKATMKELYDALTPKVRDAARRDNRDQTPQLIGDGAASL